MEVKLRKILEGQKSQNYAGALKRLSSSVYKLNKDCQKALEIISEAEKIFVEKNNQNFASLLYWKGVYLLEFGRYDDSIKSRIDSSLIYLRIFGRTNQSFIAWNKELSNLIHQNTEALRKMYDYFLVPILSNILIENYQDSICLSQLGEDLLENILSDSEVEKIKSGPQLRVMAENFRLF